jgi:uncharacterized protein Smg (DUF494 family)
VNELKRVTDYQDKLSEENNKLKSERESIIKELKMAKSLIEDKEKELEEAKQNLQVCKAGIIALRIYQEEVENNNRASKKDKLKSQLEAEIKETKTYRRILK